MLLVQYLALHKSRTSFGLTVSEKYPNPLADLSIKIKQWIDMILMNLK